ncbi:endothelin-converting enzyme 1-like [Haemaphysalis longicornis]
MDTGAPHRLPPSSHRLGHPGWSRQPPVAHQAASPTHRFYQGGAGESSCVLEENPRWSWYRYGVFVSAVTVATLALGGVVPQLVHRWLVGCAYPDCVDPGASIVQSIRAAPVGPCQDFYGYVCTGWQRANPTAGNHFEALQQRVVHAVVMSLVLHEADGPSPAHRVARLFQRCAQLAFNEQDHVDELRAFLSRFDLTWPTPRARSKAKTLELLVALSLDWGVPVLFQLSVDTNFRRPGYRNLHFAASPYMLEWFAVRDVLKEGTLFAYFDRTSDVLGAGPFMDGAVIRDILTVDNRVRSIMMPWMTDFQFDTRMLYIFMHQLDGLTGPGLTTAEWLQAVNQHLPEELGTDDEMFVMNRPMLLVLGELLQQADLGPLLAYTTWHVVRNLAPMTSHQLVQAQFDGDRRASTIYMLGRCYVDADAALPFAFVHVFARRWLPNGAVRDAASMEARIRQETNASMAALPWMDDETKSAALLKLSTLRAIVGRPEQFASEGALQLLYPYAALLPGSGSYWAQMSAFRAAQLSHTKRFLRANGSADGDVAVPLTAVNAFYIPVYHAMVVPAAILQPPFYAAGYPPAYNLGSLGHVLGHEMTHAIDPDTGLYDRDGQRRDWWTPASRALFQLRLGCLRQLYNGLPWAEGVSYGDYALNENFADSGGIVKAYRALRSVRAGATQPVAGGLEGFTEQQQFFLSSCFKWCSNNEKQSPGSYSPPRMRCNVPLMNMPEFAEAFDCGAGTTMNPPVRCSFL